MLLDCMALHEQQPLSPPDADLRFEVLIRKPAAAIALSTAVVLTAITWITTFLLTITSVAAYVTQNVALASAEKPAWNLASLVSLPGKPLGESTTVEIGSRSDTASLPTAPSSHLLTPLRPTAAPALRELSLEEPLSALTLSPQSVDARAEAATAQVQRAAQDANPSPVAQSVMAQAQATPQGPSEPQCAGGFWGGLCKERMRWGYCHPDKWDTIPECSVQKFDVSS